MLVPPCMQGDNAWVFVNEETIADTVKHYFKFENELFEAAKKVAAKNVEVKKPTELSVVIMDNKVLTPADVSNGRWGQGPGCNRVTQLAVGKGAIQGCCLLHMWVSVVPGV